MALHEKEPGALISLCKLSVLCVSLVILAGNSATTETQRTQSLHRETIGARPCGLPQPYKSPAKLEGYSLTSLLRTPQAKWDHPAFSVVMYQNKLGKSVRTERWHYVSWDDGKAGEMLLDHANDPLELTNLAGEPAYAETIKLMKRYLQQLPIGGAP